MEIHLDNYLPEYPSFVSGIRRAPDRGYSLTPAQTETALMNALRYIPVELHEKLAPEFMEELLTRGRIYGYRYRPQGDLKAKPISEYKGKCIEGKAFQVMIDNNLCFDIALYPYELVTYGETGQGCQNWMQYRKHRGRAFAGAGADEEVFGGADRGADLGDRIRASSGIVSFQAGCPTGDYHELHDGGNVR